MMSGPLNRAGRLALCAVLLGAAAYPARGFDPLSDELAPHPSMTPRDVVQIQLEALRRGLADERGIGVAFRFASPANRRLTGPLPRFERMIRNGPYALMLSYQDVRFGPLRVQGDRAVQAVTLVRGPDIMTYVFRLSRQQDAGDYRHCWMTDGVAIVPPSGRPT